MRILLWTALLLVGIALFLLPTSRSKEAEADAATPSGPFKGAVRVLIYHDFDPAEHDVTISADRLEDQLLALKQAGYRFIGPAQLAAFLEGRADLDPLSVLVTIDDGYASIYTRARPILVKHQIPTLVFLITGQIDAPLTGALPKLSRQQIKELQETGLFTFAGHSTNHGNPTVDGRSNLTTPLPGETELAFRERVAADLAQMQSVLAAIGGNPAHFAYPYGQVSEGLIAQLRQVGVRYAYTTEEAIVTPATDRMRIPRFNAGVPWLTGASLIETISTHPDSPELPLTGQV